MMNSDEFGGFPEKSWQGRQPGSPSEFQRHRQVNMNITNFHSNNPNSQNNNEYTQSPSYNGYNNGNYQFQKQLNLDFSNNPQNLATMPHHQNQQLYEQHLQQKQYQQQDYRMH